MRKNELQNVSVYHRRCPGLANDARAALFLRKQCHRLPLRRKFLQESPEYSRNFILFSFIRWAQISLVFQRRSMALSVSLLLLGEEEKPKH